MGNIIKHLSYKDIKKEDYNKTGYGNYRSLYFDICDISYKVLYNINDYHIGCHIPMLVYNFNGVENVELIPTVEYQEYIFELPGYLLWHNMWSRPEMDLININCVKSFNIRKKYKSDFVFSHKGCIYSKYHGLMLYPPEKKDKSYKIKHDRVYCSAMLSNNKYLEEIKYKNHIIRRENNIWKIL